MRFPSFLRLQCQKERRGFAHVMPQQKMMLVVRLGVDTGAERWREDDILPYKNWKMGRMKAEKMQKSRQSCIESAKNAEFNTFSTIKVCNTSLLF